MTARKIIMFLADFIILGGLYQYYFIYIIKKGWEYLGNENESLIDYISREFDSKKWRKRREKKSFNLNRYFFYRKIFGFLCVLLGLLLFVFIWWFGSTNYGFILDIRL